MFTPSPVRIADPESGTHFVPSHFHDDDPEVKMSLMAGEFGKLTAIALTPSPPAAGYRP
jgi:hypothetical protein